MPKRLRCATIMLLTLVMLLAPVLVCSGAPQMVEVALNGTEVSVAVNGTLINFPDQKPYITEGRALIPVRFVSNALGAHVKWDDPQINIETQDQSIVLIVDSKTATVNSSPISLDVPAAISGGRVMVPLRFVSQVLGAEVKWRQSDRSEQGDNNVGPKTWRVASETTYPPFEFFQNGQYAGYDIDLIRAIGEAEGYDISIRPMGFDGLIPALQNGQADCVISAMSITHPRLQVVDASEPYFIDGLVVSVHKDNTNITGLEDLKGKKLGAEVGTTGMEACNDVKIMDPATEVKVFDSIGEAFMELEKGGVDAVISDWAITRYYCKTIGTKLKTLEDTFQPKTNEQYGIYVKKGNSNLLAMINDGLKKLKADGTMDQLKEKWFGDTQ
ncbi:MAG: transporter substrate-binding domain-containing protein [Syntrophomonas sp.]|nr:transporter substrate-binding domain-containing protein [Syntrophomonas sp.]